MTKFEELLNAPLPSTDPFYEAVKDEEEKDTGAEEGAEEKEDNKEAKNDDRQSIVDKIEKALKDIENVSLAKKDADGFVSGDENEIELEDLDEDIVGDVHDAISSALEDFDSIKVEKDDDEVTISFEESVEEETDDMPDEATEEDADEEDGEDDDIEDALDDLEDKSDDELEDELSDIDPEDEDEPEEKELDPEEDKKADDMLAMVATPMLIKDELTAEESVKFYESVDGEIAVDEGLVMESSLDEIYTEGVFVSPNKPFKMTKQARLRQLYELSVQIEARAHRDPLMKQLDKAYAIERRIKKNLRQKYHAAATKRAKGYLMRLIKSKSGVLKNLGKKIAPTK